jgi:hypothetical protein
MTGRMLALWILLFLLTVLCLAGPILLFMMIGSGDLL